MAYVIVNGTVNRVFYGGKGVNVKETFKLRDGSTGEKYFTAWFEEDPGLVEGVTGQFSGLLNFKKNEYEDKNGEARVGIDASINGAKFEAVDNEEEPF